MTAKLIIVEGNICSGKTTMSSAISKLFPQCKLFIEPSVENPYLERYYKDPKKWALTIQMYLLKLRFAVILEAITCVENGTTAIMDRSIWSDYVFAKQNYIDGNMTKEEFDQYMEERNNMMSNIRLPDLCIYLNTTASACYMKLVNIRKRTCELGIPIEYMIGIEKRYGELIEELKKRKVSIMSIDWFEINDPEVVVAKIDKY